ncbi:hypothetical protein J5Y03_01485 [Bacillus sp. RG28]|uniref:Uncharacterized protein n=1 Tax=Gottfriedia endophytica TaxID=2820819 RepID=A0A940NS20_9BACI|nr:hypothetical protein [Gottfriedia endophytica]MBP0723853.1 hypothetical protein [Gottfriedia endophytica]
MTKKNNFIQNIIFLLCIIVIIGTIYYFRPLSANNVFPELENVEKIAFIVRFDEKKDAEIKNIEIKEKEVDYFINLLEMTKYQRVFGETNIQSQTNAFDIVIVHNSSNYSIVINNKGYVVVDEMNSKKKYKILSSKNDTLIKLIDEMLNSK